MKKIANKKNCGDFKLELLVNNWQIENTTA